MTILFCILKSIFVYFILMLIGTNLLGMAVRGIIPSYKKDNHGNLQLVEVITSSKSILITIFLSLVCILYIYGLFYYWNIGLAVAGIILMLTRIPDLLFEMKTGEKVNFKNMPKRPIDIFCSLLTWGELPLIWYSLCFLN